MNQSRMSIVVADDHPVVLRGIVGVLQSCPAMCVLAACGDGSSALEAIRTMEPDIAARTSASSTPLIPTTFMRNIKADTSAG